MIYKFGGWKAIVFYFVLLKKFSFHVVPISNPDVFVSRKERVSLFESRISLMLQGKGGGGVVSKKR